MNSLTHLPTELLVHICALVPLGTLTHLLCVSWTARRAASKFFQSMETLTCEGYTPRQISTIVEHCCELKTIIGLVLSCSAKKQVSEHQHTVPVAALFRLLNVNPRLERIVLYDHGVQDPSYLPKLLNTLKQRCPRLKTLYSEARLGEEAVPSFLDTPSLEEVAFPNMLVRHILSQKRWTGALPSCSNIRHASTNQLVYVWQKSVEEEGTSKKNNLTGGAAEVVFPPNPVAGRSARSVLASSMRSTTKLVGSRTAGPEISLFIAPVGSDRCRASQVEMPVVQVVDGYRT